MGVLLFEGSLTIKKADEGLRLFKLSRLIEPINSVKAVSYMTMRLADNFNVGRNFTIEQSNIMALDLLDRMKYETLEDIVLMFRYGRQGLIGDGKDFKLDSQTVFHKWMPQYLDMKAEQRENDHNKAKGELNSTLNFSWSKDDLQNFELSDEDYSNITEGNGFGARLKASLSVPAEIVAPQRTRSEYLEILKQTAQKLNIDQLKATLSFADGDTSDAIFAEIKKRGYNPKDFITKISESQHLTNN